MTASRDPDHLIHAFLLEGAEQLDDQVYDAVRAEIEQKRQRAVIGPWRMPTLNKLVPIGLATAAVLVVLVVGSRLLGPSTSNVGGPGVEPTPTPEASVAAPSAAASPDGAAGLPEGPFTIIDYGDPNAALSITVTIPTSGWRSYPDFGGIGKGDEADPPEAAMLAWSWPAGTDFYVYGDPCHWAATTPDTPATTVDQIVTALSAQASRNASAPVDVTVGGYAGKQITLHVPNDPEAITDCDEDMFASYGSVDPDNEPNRRHQGPGQIDEFWILDAHDAIAIIDVMYRPSTSAALLEELRAIAESATFEAS